MKKILAIPVPLEVLIEKKIYSNGDVYEGHLDSEGQPHGQGTYTNSDGGVRSGEWRRGKRHGLGVTTYRNGVIYAGEGVADSWHGLGTLTFNNCDQYEGQWKNGIYTHLDTSQRELVCLMGTRVFAYLLAGIDTQAPPYGYIQPIILAHFDKFIHEKGAPDNLVFIFDQLKFAFELWGGTPKEAKTSIIDQLKTKNEIVLPFGYIGHAMLLKISFVEAGLKIEVYNSGGGLDLYHKRHPARPTKFQTCLTYWFQGVSQNSETFLNLLESIVGYRDKTEAQAYGIFNTGTVLLNQMEYQREQKSGNCQLECIMAFLKRNLGTSLYNEYRLQLSLDTKSQIQTSKVEDVRLEKRLNRMIERRGRKLHSPFFHTRANSYRGYLSKA